MCSLRRCFGLRPCSTYHPLPPETVHLGRKQRELARQVFAFTFRGLLNRANAIGRSESVREGGEARGLAFGELGQLEPHGAFVFHSPSPVRDHTRANAERLLHRLESTERSDESVENRAPTRGAHGTLPCLRSFSTKSSARLAMRRSRRLPTCANVWMASLHETSLTSSVSWSVWCVLATQYIR